MHDASTGSAGFANRLEAARPVRAWARRWFAGLSTATLLICTAARAEFMASADGRLEAGVPAFVVYSPDSLGLGSRPTDIAVLPDGRLVLVAGTLLAFGDGSSWEVFSPASSSVDAALQPDLCVGPDGSLYNGMVGGVRRIDLGGNGRWSFTPVAQTPATHEAANLPINEVFKADGGWFWLSSSGHVFEWTPGNSMRLVCDLPDVEYVFSIGPRLFLRRTSGGLVEFKDGTVSAVPAFANLPRSFIVTSLVPWGEGKVLLGTQTDGLVLFDGTSLVPFVLDGGVTQVRQVNDLCQTAEGLTCAATGSTGLVFFNREGRIIQALDRSLDIRLGSTLRLRYIDGVVWAILAQGIARVEFPSPFSDFGPLIPTLMSYSKPYRHDGRLWMLSDGVAMRAEYSNTGRLTGFVPDSPQADSPDRDYIWTLASVDGEMLACGSDGIYIRGSGGWSLAVGGLVNARIETQGPDGRWLYVARGEIGWIQCRDGMPVLERHPVDGLEDNYALVRDKDSVVWLELGAGRTGRIDLRQAELGLNTLTTRNGLPGSWVQLLEFDGEVVFSIAENIYRFDPTTERFAPHARWTDKLSSAQGALGRPTRDALGRLWVNAGERITVTDEKPGAGRPLVPKVPPSLELGATSFHMEEGGIVWILGEQLLARYDPSVAAPRLSEVRPMITRVRFPATGRIAFGPLGTLTLSFEDNSLEIHFSAPRNPFRQLVAYEIMMEGLGETWIPAEHTAVAAYNHLLEGNYRFRVRAVVNGAPQGEASLDIAITPPWHRTTAAYTAYALAALGLLGGAGAIVSYIPRRDKRRLAALVARRTAELQTSQDELRRAVESGSVGLWEFDINHGRFTWNEQFRLIYGLKHDAAAAAQRFEDLSHPLDRERMRHAYRNALENHSEIHLEHRILRPDGTERWAVAIGRGVYDEHGAPTAMRGAVIDTTERRQAEEEIRNRELLQRQMIESSPVAMVMIDRQQSILHGNATFNRLFGYSFEEVPDVNAWWPRAYPDPEYRDLIRTEWMRRIEKATNAQSPIEPMDAIVTCKDGIRRSIQFSSSEIGDRTLVVFTDLTDRKQAEQAIRDMNATLERRVRERTAELESANKELESFSYSVSHDLRAPLRGIDGWSLALLEDYGDRLDATGTNYLQRVRTESQRLGILIDDLLKLSRTTRAEFRPVPLDLSELITSTATRVADTRPESRVHFSCPPGLRAEGDPTLLEVALFNLLDNAWKFSSKSASPLVEAGCAETLSGAAFFVRDNGAGFDMRHARKLFGVFQRMHAQEDFPGTGVGLATVQRIIQRHGGRVWADSTPGEQTTFFFQLPGLRHSGPAPETSTPTHHERTHHTTR